MNSEVIKSKAKRDKRALRVRKKLKRSGPALRLSIFKSNVHLYVQLIDDEKQVTIFGLSTLSKTFQNTEYNRKNKASAQALGKACAEKLQAEKISEIKVDRGPFKYHGIIAAFVDTLRESGIQV